MLLYSIIEVFSKFTGIFILAIFARSLTTESFAEYSIAMVFFSYFIEFSFFAFQTKNLSDYHASDRFIYGEVFARRQLLVFILSFFALILFNVFSLAYLNINVVALSLVLLLCALNFDIILYVSGNSHLVALSRFFSQIIFFVFTFVFSLFFEIDEDNVMLLQLINSLSLTLFIFYFAVYNCKFNINTFLMRLIEMKITLKGFYFEISSQVQVFLSKIFTILVVTVELPLLLLINNSVKDVFSISYRIALIVLPFTIFFLNSNVGNISEKNLIRNSLFISICACFLVLLSPVVVFFIFGEKYIENAIDYSIFYIVIPFQAIINYVFYLALKVESDMKFFKALWLITIIYSVFFIFMGLSIEMSIDFVALFLLFKMVACVAALGFISVNSRLILTFLISVPLLFYYIMDSSNAMFLLNKILIDSILNFGDYA